MSKCIHIWQIQAASGPTSDGECAKCGLVRRFTNYVETKDIYRAFEPKEAREPVWHRDWNK